MKIKAKMITCFSAICIGCMLIAMLSVLSITRSRFTAMNDNYSQASADFYAAEIQAWLERKTSVVDSAAVYLESLAVVDEDAVTDYLSALIKATEGTTDVFAAFTNGTFLDGSNPDLGSDWDYTGYPWYTEALATDEKVYCDPYMDGSMVLPVSKQFTCRNGASGVIGMSLQLQTMFDTVNQISDSSDGSYVFLTDETGMILMHPNSDYMPSQTSTCILPDEYAAAIADGTAVEDYDGVSRYLKSVPCSVGSVIVATPVSVYNEATNQLIVLFLVTILIAAAIAAAVVALFSGSITRPIAAMQNEITELRELKLQMDNSSALQERGDEIGIMDKAIQELRLHLNQIVHQMVAAANTLMEQFDNVQESLNNSVTDNQSVKETVNQFAVAIDDVAQQTQQANMNFAEFAERLSVVADRMERMDQVTAAAVRQCHNGVKTVEQLSTKIDHSRDLQNVTYETANLLSQKSVSIGGISKTINEIAGQTSLLALNASIEAARAGDAGKGFVVVAEEIGNLASQAASATSDINQIITEIQNEIRNVGIQIGQLQDTTNDCMDAMADTQGVFQKISNDISGIGDDISELENEIDNLNQNKDGIVDRFSNISSETQELTAATQEVRERVENQSTEMDHINISMNELNEVVNRLNSIIEKFSV